MAVTINASTSAGAVTTADTSGVLQLQTGGTTALTVDASQNVGIGLTNPTFQLQMSGGTTVDSRIQLNRGSDDGAQNLRLGWNAIKTTRTSNALSTAQTNLDFVQVGSDGERICFSMGTNGSLEVNLGIKFPATQVTSADANTLDDYEEGTWTPSAFNGGGTGITYVASYVKIGRQVSCFFSINGTGLTTTAGGTTLSGLPFPPSSVPTGSAATYIGISMIGQTNNGGAIQAFTDSKIYFAVTFSSTTQISGTVTYLTST